MLIANEQLAISTMMGAFAMPVLLSNIVGGTALFALIYHAQVMNEI